MMFGSRTAAAVVLAAAQCGWAQAADAVDQSRAQDSYQKFLDLASQDDPRRAAALRRLGDIEIQLAEQQQLDGDDLAAAQAHYDRAIELYRSLLREWPDQDDNDTVLYQLARAFEQRGDVGSAIAHLATLIERYPGSDLVIESHFRRGEAQFASGNEDLAAAAYMAILEREDAPASPFYEQALYKYGWARFRIGEYDEALAGFLVLLNHGLAPGGRYDAVAHDALPAGRRALIDDALRAMSISYSYLDGVDTLNALLARRAAPGFEHLLYQDLGALYLDQKRYSDAARAYGDYVATYPTAVRAPYLQLSVIDTYRAAGFPEQELAAKESLVDRYSLVAEAGYWAVHARDEQPDIVEAIKRHLTELAAHYHARSSDDPATVDRAVDYYKTWLASFPDAEEAPGQHFLLAELLYANERFKNATDAYTAAAYRYGDHADAADAGYAALLAFNEYESTLEGDDAVLVARRAVENGLRFVAQFPDHPERNAVLVNASERLFKFGDWARARDAARALVAFSPAAQTDQLRVARTVEGHASFALNDFVASERAYAAVLALGVDDPDRYDQLYERLAASVYKQGDTARSQGDLETAVDRFLRVADVTPKSAAVPTANYDAAAALVQLEDWTRAASVLERFRAQFPGHPLASNVTRELIGVYLNDGRQTDAAVELDGIARDDNVDAAVRGDAVVQAATLYRELGDVSGERAAIRYRLNALNVGPEESVDLHERLAALAFDAGNFAERDAELVAIIQLHRSAPAPTERLTSAAASASMNLADTGLDSFMGIELDVPLAASLARKKDAMTSLLTAYGEAADYGVGPVTTAATFRIGELYREMARALMASERPPELSELEAQEYDFLLEEQAFPFEEKAIEVYEANARRSATGMYDQWVRKSFDALAVMMPARYAKLEKGVRFASRLR
ncbi:MAG: tetratricopeptide repeat protein [Pseudomonadota bacterium]